jgi:hypothetical protein
MLLASGTIGKMSCSALSPMLSSNCGPGTLVTTRFTNRWGIGRRTAWSIRFGGAKPVSSVSALAPMGWPDFLSPDIASEIWLRQSRGSSQPIGSGAMMPPTWLPSFSPPRSSSARMETGTNALMVRPLMSSPRFWRWARSARATTVRITSLTVPPSSFLIALTSSSLPRTHVKRRLVPTSREL